MKKTISIVLTVAAVALLLSSCKGDTIKDGAAVTNAVGETLAVVTNPDGGIARDEAGNAIVVQTEEGGKAVTNKDGSNVTNPVALDHALIIGNKIEMNTFSFTIPDGWSDIGSHATCIVRKDNSTDQIEIRTFAGGTLAETKKGCLQVYDLLKSIYGETGGKFTEGTAKIDNVEASTYECYISKEVSGKDVLTYWSYFFFERGGTVYVIQVSSNDNDLTGSSEITGILNSIKFV